MFKQQPLSQPMDLEVLRSGAPLSIARERERERERTSRPVVNILAEALYFVIGILCHCHTLSSPQAPCADRAFKQHKIVKSKMQSRRAQTTQTPTSLILEKYSYKGLQDPPQKWPTMAIYHWFVWTGGLGTDLPHVCKTSVTWDGSNGGS
jgi:hypothetical protein